MAKEKFERLLYRGPVSTLAVGTMAEGSFKLDPKAKPISLITGQVYPDGKVKALPLDHPTVKSLIARKMLVDATAAPPETPVSASSIGKSKK